MQSLFPRFYIGDIHGCADELRSLLQFIEEFCLVQNIKPQVTFLGDLTDRGPRSMQAVELVDRSVKSWAGSLCLRGNHDDAFLRHVATRCNTPDANQWLDDFCGLTTLASYSTDLRRSVIFPYMESRFSHHLTLLMVAKSCSMDGPFFACHAGIRPGVALKDQTHFDLTWIRNEFLEHVDASMTPVIHGHSIMGERPVVTENRISIDTGCFATGRLTACFVDDRTPGLRFFQAQRDRVDEVEPVLLDRNCGTVFDRLPELFATKKAA